jgi:hypothetical protein
MSIDERNVVVPEYVLRAADVAAGARQLAVALPELVL